MYLITEDHVDAYAMNVVMTKLGSWKTTMPAPPANDVANASTLRERKWSAASQAITIAGQTHLFVVGLQQKGTVLYTTLPALTAASAQQRTSGPGGDAQTDAAPPAPGATTFPAEAVVGQKIQHALMLPGAIGVFTVLVGPKGMSVSENGTVSWTPAGDDIGVQHVKIRAVVGGATTYLRFSCTVTSAEASTGSVGGGVAQNAPGTPGTQVLVSDRYDFALGMGGNDALLLQNNSLTVIDRDGLASSTIDLPGAYRFVRERERYYVCVSEKQLDLIDKNTHLVTRSISRSDAGR